MSFPDTHMPLRTDASFRGKHDKFHHKSNTVLEELPIDMVEDFVVADSLHLLDLGKPGTLRCTVDDPIIYTKHNSAYSNQVS